MNLEQLETHEIPPLIWIDTLEKSVRKKRKKTRNSKYTFIYSVGLSNDIDEMREEIELIRKEYKEKYNIELLSIRWCIDCGIYDPCYPEEYKQCENQKDIFLQKKICPNWKEKMKE